MTFPAFFRKSLLFLLFYYCCPSGTFAIGHYATGDTLYIWAYHGLSLRSSPSIKGIKKQTISYGESVVVLDSVKVQAFSVEDMPGITLQGYWSKVRYRNLEGWMFNGYLSKYPALSKAEKKYADQRGKEPLLAYAEKNFGRASKRRLEINSDHPTRDSLNRRDIYTYRNGVIIEDYLAQEGDGGGSGQTYAFPDFSFEECYLLFVYNLDFSGYDPRYNKPDPDTVWPKITERDENLLVIEMDLYEYRFEKQGNLTHIVSTNLF